MLLDPAALTSPDAIVAATVLATDRVLMIPNRRHFERIGGLEVAEEN